MDGRKIDGYRITCDWAHSRRSSGRGGGGGRGGEYCSPGEPLTSYHTKLVQDTEVEDELVLMTDASRVTDTDTLPGTAGGKCVTF